MHLPILFKLLSCFTFPLSLVTLSTSFQSSFSAAIRHKGPSSEIIKLTPIFFYSGFYGNNAKTQLGLIRPCPQSLCLPAELNVLRETDRCLPTALKHQSVKCLIHCSGLAISQLSATLPEQDQPGTNQSCVAPFYVCPLEVWCVIVK